MDLIVGRLNHKEFMMLGFSKIADAYCDIKQYSKEREKLISIAPTVELRDVLINEIHNADEAANGLINFLRGQASAGNFYVADLVKRIESGEYVVESFNDDDLKLMA